MKNLTMILSASVLSIGMITASGCAVMTAGVNKNDERSMARSINDVSAVRAIRARMYRAEGFNLRGVDIDAGEGIILLSGKVPREEDRVEAERIAWSADRVQQVGNEIKIEGNQGTVANIKDGMLNQSIRGRLIATKAVKARNFGIEVQDGTVYLTGIARTPEELALAAHIASTTRGAKEVISYAKVHGDNSADYATGPGYNGVPSEMASRSIAPQPLTEYSAPQAILPQASLPQVSQPQTNSTILDSDAIQSGEPYYLDPQTGERVEIPEGVTPIPYMPDAGPGSLGAGAQQIPGALPTDEYLGTNRVGTPGQAVSVIESAPYMLDPATGEMVPVKFDGSGWVPLLIK